jgi:hypothetical protein
MAETLHVSGWTVRPVFMSQNHLDLPYKQVHKLDFQSCQHRNRKYVTSLLPPYTLPAKHGLLHVLLNGRKDSRNVDYVLQFVCSL